MEQNQIETTRTKRKEKIGLWLQNPYNVALVLILSFALVIRLYIFSITQNQVLWWDEAGYLSQARAYVTNLPSGKMAGTEIIVPFFWGILYFLIPGEILQRLGQVVISFLIVFVTYYFGKKLFDRTTGLVAAFFVACNGILLFYTGRLLLYLWPPLTITTLLFFFYKGYVLKQGVKYTYISAFLLSFCTILYSTSFLAVPIILLFLFFTERFHFLKDREFWKPMTIGILPLILYFIISQLTVGYIHPRFNFAQGVAGNTSSINFANIFAYFKLAPHMFGWLWIIILLMGLFFLLEIFLIFDMILKGKADEKHKSKLFVLIWFLVIAVFYSVYQLFARANDAFIMPIFPVIGIIIGNAISTMSKILKKYSKLLIILLLLFVLFAGYSQVNYGNKLVEAKITSYAQVKEAGIWMRDNSNPEDTILSRSHPQNVFYSERETLIYPSTKEELDSLILKEHPKYLVLSVFESHEPWLYNYPNNNSMLVPVQAYFASPDQQQPLLVIYEIQYPINST
ncbi:MAG: hypothetical protein ABIH59_00130 [archaeon]